MLNIIILHHFDYPEGMATTKRFQLFADYFKSQGCMVTFVLKVHGIKSYGIETGVHKEICYYKIYFEKNKKYPFYFDKRQHVQLLETIEKLYKEDNRNIILTGGISPEFLIVVRKLIPKWELYCDYVEDFTTISSHYSGLWKENLWQYLKTRTATFIYAPFVKRAEHFMFKEAKGISAISPYLYKKAILHASNVISVPVTANKIQVIPELEPHKPITLYFAGTGSLKDGLDIVAKAFDIVSDHYDVLLKISGKNFQDGKNLVTKNCKHIEKVMFLGYLDDSAYYTELQKADIMLITRNNSTFANAGFPFKLGEYLATSNPVITTRVSGIEKYLENKKNAIVIEPGDVNDLVKGIIFLIENKEEAKQIGLAGYKVFEDHFFAETNCLKFYNFICKTT